MIEGSISYGNKEVCGITVEEKDITLEIGKLSAAFTFFPILLNLWQQREAEHDLIEMAKWRGYTIRITKGPFSITL